MAVQLFSWSAALCIALLGAYLYSLAQGLFFAFWWWDIPMHVVGGMLAALIGAWCAAVLGYRPSYGAALCGALVLGIGVEVAEYVFGFTYSPFMSYPVDTVKDLVNDIIGALIIGYLLSRV